jgi:hypothetical protein
MSAVEKVNIFSDGADSSTVTNCKGFGGSYHQWQLHQ